MHVESASSPSPRRGRPPKAEDVRLTERVIFRVTKAEADSAYRYAIRHGRPLNAVLRAVLKRLTDRW